MFQDLIKELVDELRGNFEDLVVALMYTPAEYDCRELDYAMRVCVDVSKFTFSYTIIFSRESEPTKRYWSKLCPREPMPKFRP